MGKVLTKTMWNLSQFSDVDFAIKDMFFFLPVGGANSVPPIHLDGPKCCWILSSKCDIKLQGKHISGWWFGT